MNAKTPPPFGGGAIVDYKINESHTDLSDKES